MNIVDPEVDEWVLVLYDDKQYPGIVMSKLNDSFEVTVMVPAGSYWKWPSPKDVLFYNKKDILKKLQKPIPVNNRGHFSFDF